MDIRENAGGQDIVQQMERLAAEISVDGKKRLALPHGVNKYIQKLPVLIARVDNDTEEMRGLAGHMRRLQVCARRASLEYAEVLPACGGEPRILMIAAVIADGEHSTDMEEIKRALAAFDRAQGLTMGEYMAFPAAARICICKGAVSAAERLINDAAARTHARKWLENGGADGELQGQSAAFFETALRLADETERPDIRRRLEAALTRRDRSAEDMSRMAQERRAHAVRRLNGLMELCCALEEADWQTIFESASRTEAELRRDPAGVYPKMAPESRAAVRGQLAVIAQRLDVGELTAARYAVNGAREADAADVRGCVCWWIYDDAGRRALSERLGVKARLPRLHPDPEGHGLMAMQLAATIIISAVFCGACGSAWWLAILLIPSWQLAGQLIAQAVTRIMRPRAALRLEFDTLPDSARTLVAIPALMNTLERARNLCRQLETLGCLETDENLDFVLLGDLADAKTRVCDTDAAVIAAARDEICRMNAAAGREKYHFLHREREYVPGDDIWRGRERKRGALMALCRTATGMGGGEFAADGNDEKYISGKFRYIVTLDSDTGMLPGTAHALAGAIAHPINRVRFDGLRRRGFAVMQPRIELDARSCRSEFARIFGGNGGLSTYSGMVSDMLHDLTGTGAYCGKAVIDAPAFLELVEGKLDPRRILSHDYIEGALAGAGHINDIALFDGFPENYQKWLSRLARWTRGDWQLMPELIRSDIPLMCRFRMLSNLVESLREAALMLMLILAVWLGNVSVFALTLLFIFAMPIFARITGDRIALQRGCIELAALPAAAYARLDAVCRALWRTFVSGKGLLEWVTSADSSGDVRMVKTACRAGAILMLPALFNPGWFAPAAALAALFCVAPGLLADMADSPVIKPQILDDGQKAALTDIARDTWRFFERYVEARGNFLPPDNVQLEPGPVTARRTSPTNIAMYMLSCLCARDMGFIDSIEMRARLGDTAATLERMEKWRGQIYNWYDIDTLQPLEPLYASAVDSGNLAAALLTCANGCGDDKLAVRLRILAENMDLGALYDEKRGLFHIGIYAEDSQPGPSHYDLLASESRILSYTAIMLNKAPLKHWRMLGRPASGGVLMSWSGTMFEYLMPALIMPSAPGTLLQETYKGAVRVQMQYAARRNRPWGVSESGYHSFDAKNNYCYRAFGMRALSMSGTAPQDVIAPYAACLALMAEPRAAAENIISMRDKGWAGECGLYEAVDFVRAEPRVVKSWMAHHQGMALCALSNVLTGNKLHGYFMADPRARGLEILLNERAAPRIRLKHVPEHELNPDELSSLNERT